MLSNVKRDIGKYLWILIKNKSSVNQICEAEIKISDVNIISKFFVDL